MLWKMAVRLWGLWWGGGVVGRERGAPLVVLPCLPPLPRFMGREWGMERRTWVMGRGRAGSQVQEAITDKRCGRGKRDKRGCVRISWKGKVGRVGVWMVKRQGPLSR